jgi:RNA-directed DNA polymerase
VKEPATENRPAAVGRKGLSPTFSKQAGEAHATKHWVERSVWTERMLERLAQSQEQTVWYSLWDKVCHQENLNQATLRVILNKGSAGVDGYRTEELAKDWTRQCDQLASELKNGGYQPKPALRAWIPKLGSPELRPLGIPAVRDRVVQTALRAVMEPIFERDFAEQSYGFRPKRGALEALARVEELLMSGHTWVVDADLKAYFDTIPHERLMELVRVRIADGKVLGLLEKYLRAGVMDSMKGWQATTQGTPQGGVISPLLANLYLNPMDHQMEKSGREMVRYADDFVVCVRSETEAQEAWAEIAAWVKKAGLALHPVKTQIINAAERGGFDFLGYHFEQYGRDGGKKWPREKSQFKLRETLRAKLSRSRPGSVPLIASEVNRTLRGWYHYFKWSQPSAMQRVDEWTRERIRHILRKRQKRQGMVHARERNEYGIGWFAEQGLVSLTRVQVLWLQSREGNH